jgi:hypothetical protein
LITQVPLVPLRRYISDMPRASDGPLYGRRRIFSRSLALRLSRAFSTFYESKGFPSARE